jgi:hypothetical protein
MRGDSPAADARRRERARCAAILTSAAGLKHPELACVLAFRTRVSRSEALGVLAVVEAPWASQWAHLEPAPQRPGMARWPRPQPRTFH